MAQFDQAEDETTPGMDVRRKSEGPYLPIKHTVTMVEEHREEASPSEGSEVATGGGDGGMESERVESMSLNRYNMQLAAPATHLAPRLLNCPLQNRHYP